MTPPLPVLEPAADDGRVLRGGPWRRAVGDEPTGGRVLGQAHSAGEAEVRVGGGAEDGVVHLRRSIELKQGEGGRGRRALDVPLLVKAALMAPAPRMVWVDA